MPQNDNGPALVGEALDPRTRTHCMAIPYIQLDKPNPNGCIGCVDRTFREAVLDQHPFARLDMFGNRLGGGCSGTTNNGPTPRSAA